MDNQKSEEKIGTFSSIHLTEIPKRPLPTIKGPLIICRIGDEGVNEFLSGVQHETFYTETYLYAYFTPTGDEDSRASKHGLQFMTLEKACKGWCFEELKTEAKVSVVFKDELD